jgi:hypothetical protein
MILSSHHQKKEIHLRLEVELTIKHEKYRSADVHNSEEYCKTVR